ncbi:MAG: hypothetical protein HRT90_11395 [Candidatus Margulisbacteria bacterium]|nr:hypothetical protein [Candidatus Margulisiibacteriota bacterium]
MSSNHSETNNIEIIGFQNYEKENALINKYLDGLDGNSHMSRFDYIVQKWGYQDPDTTLEGLFKHFRANGGSSKNFMELHFNTRTDEKHLFGTLETWHLERLQEKYFLKSKKPYCIHDFYRRGNGHKSYYKFDPTKKDITVEEYDKPGLKIRERFLKMFLNPGDEVTYFWSWPVEYMKLPVLKYEEFPTVMDIIPWPTKDTKLYFIDEEADKYNLNWKMLNEKKVYYLPVKIIPTPKAFKTYNAKMESEIENKENFKKYYSDKRTHSLTRLHPWVSEWFVEKDPGRFQYNIGDRLIFIQNHTQKRIYGFFFQDYYGVRPGNLRWLVDRIVEDIRKEGFHLKKDRFLTEGASSWLKK